MEGNQISEDNIAVLKEKMHSLGFPERLDQSLDYYAHQSNFRLPYVTQIENDTLYCNLHFETNHDGTYDFTSYDATLREEIAIPEMNMEGINTKDLDDKLKLIDRWYDEALGFDFENKQPEEVNEINGTIRSTHAQLLKLQGLEGEGNEVAKLLMFKYFPEIDYQKFFPDYYAMKEKFEVQCKVTVGDGGGLSVEETYNHLKDLTAKRLMQKEHVISDEAMKEMQTAIANQEYWIAYNTMSYFLENGDVYSFKSEEDAEEFSMNNVNDHDSFKIIKAFSVDDVLKQIPYGKVLDNYLNHTKAQSLSPLTERSFYDLHRKDLVRLKNDLNNLGFSERLIPAIEFYINRSEHHFQLSERERSQNEKTNYVLSFEKNLNTNEYYLKEYEGTLRIHPEIPDITVEGINSKELDARMKAIDWAIDHHAESLVYDYVETQEGRKFLNSIDAILKDIDKMYQSDGIGKDATEKLMYKHWYGEPWEPNTLSLEHLRQNYEWAKTVNGDESGIQSKFETYRQLREVAQKDLEIVNKHFITNQSLVMNEQNLQYLKDNIKYLGFGEKLFPDLQKNMEQGLPEFQLKISTEFHNDKIGAELHFRKSETNDMYFLNRYDATLKKPDGKELSQPFQLNKGNGVTVKEAYNMLNGRAVNKDLLNKEGQKFNVWLQLDFTQKNERGNYETNKFYENYGYNLEYAVSKFAIKELTDKEQKEALIKSLQKGNLQSATFEVNGKEQRMFIEANPKLKTINIYDTTMKLQKHDSLKKNDNKEQLNGKEHKENIQEKTTNKSNDKSQDIGQSNKKGKVVKMNSEDSLLPKKRTSQKKGLTPS